MTNGWDIISSYVISYLAFVICCMNDPHAFFSLANDEPIETLNVATNALQAKQVFFAKLKARIKRPCFSEFVMPRGIKTDAIELINHLTLHSKHSQNEGFEGMNVIAYVMDESSAFRTANGVDNPDNVYGTLKSSAKSRFSQLHWVVLISCECGFVRERPGGLASSPPQNVSRTTSREWLATAVGTLCEPCALLVFAQARATL